MVKTVRIIIATLVVLLFFGGCASKSLNSPSNDLVADWQKEAQVKKLAPPPPLVLPKPYEKPSPFEGKTFTFTVERAPLSSLLYAIAEDAGLNLIIDNDIDVTAPITLTLTEVPLKSALDTVMRISGCYYDIDGNILHVKQMMTKTFKIPYIHSITSFESNLGGDLLGTAQQGGTGNTGGGGLKGEFALKYDNPQEVNDFYEQLETNVAKVLSKKGNYTLNKFTGILVVTDKKENVDRIEGMIGDIMHHASMGVLIEAKVLEVILGDGHEMGVDWNYLFRNFASEGTLSISQTLGLGGSVAGAVKFSGDNLNILMQVLKTTGKVETLSNPRIRVLSGQSALISSGKIVPFWEREVTYTAVTSGSTTTLVPEVTHQRRDVLDGISMGVMPVVQENGEILLSIVPISTTIEDITKLYENGQEVASAPILNIKEAGTVIKAKDNDLIVIGGLISDSVSDQEEAVPLLSDFPAIGNLFKKSSKKKEKRELVILLRLKIENGE